MARRENHFTVSDEKSRDYKKTFKIVEMSAWDAEDWALRVLLALVKAGAELPPELSERINNKEVGISDIAMLGLGALKGLQYQDAKPLLDDMMNCVLVCVPNVPIPRDLTQDDVEEVSTIAELRKRVMSLHLNFSQAADTQNTAI